MSSNRIVPIVLIALLALTHMQLWFSRGGVPNMAALQRRLSEQNAANAQAQLVNDRLSSEVDDLKDGLGMVEERARVELGMVKPNEIFVQLNPRAK